MCKTTFDILSIVKIYHALNVTMTSLKAISSVILNILSLRHNLKVRQDGIKSLFTAMKELSYCTVPPNVLLALAKPV